MTRDPQRPEASGGVGTTLRILPRIKAWLAAEPMLAILLLAAIALQIGAPRPWRALPALVDWQTVLTLAGLMMLTHAIQLSGALDRLAHRLLQRVASERALACLLVLFAAALATVLTNDVSLFVVIPLVRSLHKLNPLPIKRLVIVIALAVNAGSILTPLGNPQNLFLWQSSGVSFGVFTAALAPLACALTLLLLGLTALLFGARPLDLSADRVVQPVDKPLFALTLCAFVIFVVLADLHRAGWALLAVVLGYGLWRRAVVLSVDAALLGIFVLMFIVLRAAAALPAVQAVLAHWHLAAPTHLYTAGALLSQGISNVPATIMLVEFSHDWRVLAYAVSVGGFGFALGSLANLIAVRLSGERGVWGQFHAISLPFFVLAAGVGAALLQYLGWAG